jgi:hypothetical protein
MAVLHLEVLLAWVQLAHLVSEDLQAISIRMQGQWVAQVEVSTILQAKEVECQDIRAFRKTQEEA